MERGASSSQMLHVSWEGGSCCFPRKNSTAILPPQVIVGNWVVLVFTFLVVQSVFNKFSGIEVRPSKALPCDDRSCVYAFQYRVVWDSALCGLTRPGLSLKRWRRAGKSDCSSLEAFSECVVCEDWCVRPAPC